MITAHQNSKYITHNTSHFKFIDPAIKEITDEEEQEDDDDWTNGESCILTRDLRLFQHGRNPLNIFVKKWLYWFVIVLK